MASSHDIGALVVVATSIRPQSSSGGTINGASVDRFAHGMPLSCVLHQMVGTVSGAPASLSVQTTLQHSADGSTWSNYEPDGATVQQTAVLAAANSENSVAIDLVMANRYVCASMAVALPGGTSPSVQVAADLVIAGAPISPEA